MEKNSLYIFITIIILFFYNNIVFCQELRNSVSITITPSTSLNIRGSFTNNSINDSHGTINNEGNINISGDWQNNTSDELNKVFTNINLTGIVEFNGTLLQKIKGTNSTKFENLKINNENDVALTQSNVLINNELTMALGDLDMQDFNMDLGLTGLLLGENALSKLKTTDGSDEGEGSGFISANKTLGIGVYADIAGLGIDLETYTDFGATTIKRGHKQLSGSGSFSENSSIFRFYELIPSSIGNNYAKVSFNILADELNEHLAEELIIFQYVNFGASSFWTPLTTNIDGLELTATTIENELPTILLTAGSETSPLPIDLVYFKTHCKSTENTNSIKLTWATAMEENNNFFSLERSIDLTQWENISVITGAGNSSSIIEYEYLDNNIRYNTNYYYRLNAIDNDGNVEIKAVTNCKCTHIYPIKMYPNPASEQIYFVNLPENSIIEIYDINSKLVKYYLSNTDTYIIPVSCLVKGVYHVRVINFDIIFNSKLIIN